MTKTSGLGDNLYIGGVDVSGDIGALTNVHGGPAALDYTDITQSAYERIGGLRDGGLGFMAYMNPARAHPVLDALPTTDIGTMYLRGTAIGNPGACCVGKQVNYDPTRGNDGALSLAVEVVANGFGLEWGSQLTVGKRTDTTATNGASLDTLASASFGAQAYLQVFAFSGTNITIKIQDSADNSTFVDVSGFAFTAVTTAPGTQRIALANTATVRQYVRVATTGTFTSCTFAVVMNKNISAGVTF